MTDISAGSIVRLKSGGPFMTVNEVVGRVYKCFWFVNEELRMGEFSKSALFNKTDIDASKVVKTA